MRPRCQLNAHARVDRRLQGPDVNVKCLNFLNFYNECLFYHFFLKAAFFGKDFFFFSLKLLPIEDLEKYKEIKRGRSSTVSQSYHPGVFCWSFREFPLVIFYKYYMHFEQQQQKDHMVHSFNDLPLYFIMHAQHLYVVNILLQYRFNGLVSH